MKLLAPLSLALFLVFAGLFATHTLGSINQDIGRHLKTGEIIWQTKSVPTTNLFSYTEPNTRFINTHWLSEVVLYLLNLLIGLKGLIIFKSLVLVLTFWLLYESVKRKASATAFIAAAIPCLFVMADRTDLRPEIFSYLFLAYFLFAIFKAKHLQDYRWMWALPFIQLVWTNMHIYFAFGLMLAGLFMIDRWLAKDPQWKFAAAITAACGLVMLINPNGLAGALAPFTILVRYGYGIVENQSVFFIHTYGILTTQINIFLLVVLLLAASFIPALQERGLKGYFFETATALIFLILGFQMIRNFGPFVIATTPILALNIQSYLNRRNLSPRAFKRLSGASIGACLVLVFMVLNSTAYSWAGSGDQFGLDIPASAQGGVDFVLAHHLSGPVFNNFDVGSYLIWKLYPDQKVFVDGRPEAYTPEFFMNIYEPMQEDPATWNHYANDVYHVEYIFFDYHDITPWAQTFLSFISQDPNWPLVYQDNSTVIFVRNDTSHAALLKSLTAPKH